jgi:flagellar motor switch protein FliM
MIVASFSVTVGGGTTRATLAVPAQALLSKLQTVTAANSGGNARTRIRDHVTQVPVEVAVQLSPAAVTPSQILGLAVGDVLPLPHLENRPFDVTLGGTRLATAAPARNGSRAAAVIVTIEENHP